MGNDFVCITHLYQGCDTRFSVEIIINIMIMDRKYGSFSSVDDPQKLSGSIESALNIIAFLVGSYATIKGTHLAIDNEAIRQSTDALVVIIGSGLTIWKAGGLLVGIFRRVVASKTE